MAEKRKRPTIIDVARLAGASVGSVSNVLNNTRPVSDELREQITRAADALGFQANSVARTLRKQRSNVVGLCMPNTASAYLNDLANELDLITTQHGYELMYMLTRQDPKSELERVRSLLGRQIDAVILLPSRRPQASLNALYLAGKPTVVVDRLVDDSRFSYVNLDNYGAMRDLAGHLMRQGHRHLLFVVQDLQVITTRHRVAALQDMAREEGGAFTYQVIEKGTDRAALVGRIGEIMSAPHRPTAVITGNSIVAVATFDVLRELDLRCPRDVALATFDDPEWATAMTPPLTTIKTPTRRMAEAVWDLIHGQLDGSLTEPRTVEIQSEISLRASSNFQFEPPMPAHQLPTPIV